MFSWSLFSAGAWTLSLRYSLSFSAASYALCTDKTIRAYAFEIPHKHNYILILIIATRRKYTYALQSSASTVSLKTYIEIENDYAFISANYLIVQILQFCLDLTNRLNRFYPIQNRCSLSKCFTFYGNFCTAALKFFFLNVFCAANKPNQCSFGVCMVNFLFCFSLFLCAGLPSLQMFSMLVLILLLLLLKSSFAQLQQLQWLRIEKRSRRTVTRQTTLSAQQQ